MPGQALVLDATLFSKCLASAPSGSAPGPGGCTNEMLKVCLDDAEVSQLLFLAAQDMARAQIPESARTFMLATMTALQKKDGGVRGIATGTSFRRLVAKTLARQFGKVVESTCAPFQFALSTRAGTDCVGHAVRAMTDADPNATILSIDSIGGLRPCLAQCHDEQIEHRSRIERVVAFRQVHVRAPNELQVAGCRWSHALGSPS